MSVWFDTLVKIKLVQMQFKPTDKCFCSSYCSQFKDKYHSKLFCCYSMKSAPQSTHSVLCKDSWLWTKEKRYSPEKQIWWRFSRRLEPSYEERSGARGASAHNECTEIVRNNEPFDGENMKSFYFCQPRPLRHRLYSKIPSSFHLTCLFIFSRPGRRREREKKRRSREHVYEI